VALRNFIRVAAIAVGLSTRSFAAGVAGDLSLTEPPNYGQRVVLRIPPEIPADAPRAAPLLSTAAAEASVAPLRQHARTRFAPISVRSADAQLLVNDEGALLLATLPKLRTFEAAKPAQRLAVA
jgi:hypothetical protein